MFHFVSLVSQSGDWLYQNSGSASVMEVESAYPVIFEEYLSGYLPIGGGVRFSASYNALLPR